MSQLPGRTEDIRRGSDGMTDRDGERRACWAASCRPPSASKLQDTNSAADHNLADTGPCTPAIREPESRGRRRKNDYVEKRIAQRSSDSCHRDLDSLSGRPEIASFVLAA